MHALTITLALIVSLLVCFLRPVYAYTVYIITLCFYPVYLVVQLGSLDISPARFVVAILFLRCVFNAGLRAKFKWCRLDSWICFLATIALIIPAISWRQPVMSVLENRSGFVMDTILAYFVARLCLTKYSEIMSSTKWCIIALMPLAILGVIESYTGWGPYTQLQAYCPWLQGTEVTLNMRSGFFRAMGPFDHPILMGTAFAMFFPMAYSLRKQSGFGRTWSYAAMGILFVGCLSSMSSGPVMMLIFTCFLLWLERYKSYVKILLVLAVIFCILVDVMSNRTFYHVLASYADPLGGSGWHRAQLIDCAIDKFSEWWKVGYGGEDPGWGQYLGMTWTDITNQYIVFGVQYGILGVVAICGILYEAIHMVVRLQRKVKDPTLRSLYWAMGCIAASFAMSFNTMTLFGQTTTLFYCTIGCVGSLSNATSRNPKATVPGKRLK